MRASIRYSLARLFVFFFFLLVLWLVGLKEPLLLLLAAGTLSLLVSMWLLSGMREAMSREVADHVEGRVRRAGRREQDGILSDDEAEDAEIVEHRDRDGRG